MTRRFYFDLASGQDFIRDDDGVEASGLEEVIVEAHAALSEIRGGEEDIAPDENWQLIIRDESGMALETLPLSNGGSH